MNFLIDDSGQIRRLTSEITILASIACYNRVDLHLSICIFVVSLNSATNNITCLVERITSQMDW